MELLGDALTRALGRKGLRLVQPDPASADEIERTLLDKPLRPTSLYAARLARAQERLRAPAAAEFTELDRRAAAGEIPHLEKLLAIAQLRDRLQAARPTDCFCFGLGGVDRRYLPPLDDEEDPAWHWDIPCPCPEGQAIETAYQAMLGQRRRQLAQQHAERLFGSLPELYRDWSFETLLALSPGHAETVETHVRAWLASEKWVLYLRGPTSTAKTGLGVPVLKQAIDQGLTALFVDVTEMLAALRDSFSNAEAFAESDSKWHALFAIDVLMVDDLGSERHKAGESVDWATETLWRLLGHRHRHVQKTIVTSNHTLNELSDKFGHARIPARLGENALGINTSNLPKLRRA